MISRGDEFSNEMGPLWLKGVAEKKTLFRYHDQTSQLPRRGFETYREQTDEALFTVNRKKQRDVAIESWNEIIILRWIEREGWPMEERAFSGLRPPLVEHFHYYTQLQGQPCLTLTHVISHFFLLIPNNVHGNEKLKKAWV